MMLGQINCPFMYAQNNRTLQTRKGLVLKVNPQPKKNSHCSFCGAAFDESLAFPRQCAQCQQVAYLNPLPVAVLLLPVDDGLLFIRRNIDPRKGKLALPGGYINLGESWQQAAARELFEETGIKTSADEIGLFNVLSAPDNTLLIFGLAKKRSAIELPQFVLSEETSECVVSRQVEEIAFPLHAQIVESFFQAGE
jgi:ADP-ribose pyrophosphatase YjhB (NUDIX family)